jgi:hypothetical protein
MAPPPVIVPPRVTWPPPVIVPRVTWPPPVIARSRHGFWCRRRSNPRTKKPITITQACLASLSLWERGWGEGKRNIAGNSIDGLVPLLGATLKRRALSELEGAGTPENSTAHQQPSTCALFLPLPGERGGVRGRPISKTTFSTLAVASPGSLLVHPVGGPCCRCSGSHMNSPGGFVTRRPSSLRTPKGRPCEQPRRLRRPEALFLAHPEGVTLMNSPEASSPGGLLSLAPRREGPVNSP